SHGASPGSPPGGGLPPRADAVREVRTVPPIAMRPRTSTRATAALSLLISMAFSTPSARTATFTGVAACPAAQRLAALIVEDTTEAGTDADARFCESTAAPPDKATPRAASGLAGISLALANRLATVPSGQPNWLATSLRLRPSRSHKTMTAR